jgi:hypothetical protein
MTIYIILDVEGNVPQHAKPFVDIPAALTYYINTAKEYEIKFDFDEVINNPTADNIKYMHLAVNDQLEDKNEGNELHWIEEDLLYTKLKYPKADNTCLNVINLLNDLQESNKDIITKRRIAYSKYLLQKYPFSLTDFDKYDEWDAFKAVQQKQ